MTSIVRVVMVVLLASALEGATSYYTGAGTVYILGVKQDILLANRYRNFNYLQYLIVSRLPQFPNKRSLVQFEDLPRACEASRIYSAKMYLYYVYAHKASWHSLKQTPFIPRYLQVHLVKKSWREDQATRRWRFKGARWSSEWLRLDGTDAEAAPQCGTVTFFPLRPSGFMEFDVTNAVKSWRHGVPNYGLLIRATNELDRGRSIRFASNAMRDRSKHAFILVRCL